MASNKADSGFPMIVHLRHLAVALTLLSGCASAGGDLCDAEEGGFTPGRVYVAFHANVNGTDEAQQIVQDEGFTILFFHSTRPRIRASVVVPDGEACAARFRLEEHPLVDFTSLERTICLAAGCIR